MKKEQEGIIRVGELSKLLGLTIWSIRRLEERGVIPHSKRIERGRWGWRYWPRSDLEQIKTEFLKYSEADKFLGGRKIAMDVDLNEPIVKFLGEVVASHSVVHSGEKLIGVLVLFNLDKKEHPQSFEIYDVLHKRG